MIVHTDTCYTLHTAHTSYQMAVGPGGVLLHTYYGPRLPDGAPCLADSRPPHDDPGCWTDLLPKEWSAPGAADHRTPPCIPAFADGSETAEPVFIQAEVTAGKPALPGLPAFRDGAGVETLAVTLRDAFGLEVQLRYTVYEAEDLITRTAVYTNVSSRPLTLHKAASLCLDFAPGPMDLITLNGTWAAERTPERGPLRWGIQSVGSTRGIPGHAHNPAAILCTPDCTETTGSCWGFALVYSGSFLIEAQRADGGQRLVMGIHPYHFHWQLESGGSFAAPEAAMVYSGQGLGEMSRRFHRAIRTRLLPPRWQDMHAPRPVLLNSWEACYFDFDQEKLLVLAAAARQADIDLFVLDDGWFKGRSDTTSSLGDWTADRNKLPGGLSELCARLNDMDMELGLWVEPEAVSPDSDLYRAHPDWALAVPGRRPVQIRHQYTLDLSRPDVVDGIWQQLEQVLRSCPIRYLKWDMNRALADVYSTAPPAFTAARACPRRPSGPKHSTIDPGRVPIRPDGKDCHEKQTPERFSLFPIHEFCRRRVPAASVLAAGLCACDHGRGVHHGGLLRGRQNGRQTGLPRLSRLLAGIPPRLRPGHPPVGPVCPSGSFDPGRLPAGAGQQRRAGRRTDRGGPPLPNWNNSIERWRILIYAANPRHQFRTLRPPGGFCRPGSRR